MLLLTSLIVITQVSNADCVSDCKKVIDAAKATIAARDTLINEQNVAISDLQSSLSHTRSDLDSSNSRLNAWYANPIIMIGLGILVGGAGVLYIEGRK